MRQDVFIKRRIVVPVITACLLNAIVGQSQTWAMHPLALKHYQQAVQFEREGNIDFAINELRNTITLDPTDSLNLLKLAALLHQQGKTNEAMAMFQKASAVAPQDSMLHFSWGAVYESISQFDKAEEQYRVGLSKNEAYIYGLLSLARVEAQQGKFTEAMQHYQTFLAKYPEHYDARRNLAHLQRVTQNNQQAAANYQLLKQQYPKRFADYLPLAKAFNQSNAPEKALQELKLAYAMDGNKSDIAAEMGNAHAVLGQLDYAIQNYEKALDLNRDDPAVSIKLAELYVTQKQPEKSIAHYQTYLAHFPQDEQAQKALTHAYLEAGHFTEATASLKQLIEKAEEEQKIDDVYQLKKRLAYAYQMNGQLGQAISVYETLHGSSLGQEDIQLKKNLAIAYHKTNQLQKAVPLYQAVYQANPQENAIIGNDLANALVELGNRAMQLNQLEKAESYYQHAHHSAKPDNMAPQQALAQLYFYQRQWNPSYAGQSEALFKSVLKQQPDNLNATLRLAALEQEAEKTTEAQIRLEALQAKKPDLIALYEPLADIYLAQEQPEKAKLLYQNALIKQPVNTELMIGQARLFNKLYLPKQSLDILTKAKGIAPKDTKVLMALGQLQAQEMLLPEAEKTFQSVLQLQPQNYMAMFSLAESLERQQKPKEAKLIYEQFLQRFPQLAQQYPSLWSQAQNKVVLLQEQTSPKTSQPQNSQTISAQQAVERAKQKLSESLLKKVPEEQVKNVEETLQKNVLPALQQGQPVKLSVPIGKGNAKEMLDINIQVGGQQKETTLLQTTTTGVPVPTTSSQPLTSQDTSQELPPLTP